MNEISEQKLYITDLENKKREITDFRAALRQAKDACNFHDHKFKLRSLDKDVIIFPEAYKYWKDIHEKLLKMVSENSELINYKLPNNN